MTTARTDRQEVDVVLRLPTTNPERIVGAELRPSRPLTAGPRRSDRWLAWTLGAALLLLGGSSVWTSAANAGTSDRLDRIEERLTVCAPDPGR